jgi:hypothetical protein
MAGRFQFSIRFLLVTTVAVAATFVTFGAEPPWQTALAMATLALSLHWMFRRKKRMPKIPAPR